MSLSSRVLKCEREYLLQSSWETRENANTSRSYSEFVGYLFDSLLKSPDVLAKYLPKEAVAMHFNGDIHIHKLPHSLWIPYCVGWNYGKILQMGLKTPTICSRPAKHLDTAVSHLVNFFYIASQEWTGAQATSGMDLFLAPFVRHDKLNFPQVKQALQKFFFELNYPSRLGYQAVFTNVTLALDSSKHYLENEAIVGGKPAGTLADYLDEALEVAKAIMLLEIDGDALGQPFTFPILTFPLTPNFDWNGRRWGEFTDIFFRTLAQRGSAYLLNGYVCDVDAVYAMCCRLTLEISKITKAREAKLAAEDLEEHLRTHRRVRGIWALPDATGSIGVATINLPRIAAESKGDWDRFEELLQKRLEVARKLLLAWRKRYEKTLREGLMPITEIYLGHLGSHFNTIGLLGLPEAAANFLRNSKLWTEPEQRAVKSAVDFERKVVEHITSVAHEYEEEDGYMYNVEEVPAESTAYRLALKDLEKYRDLAERGEVFIPLREEKPFYSNSIVPYYAELSLFDRAELEGYVQPLFTGGVMMHLFLYETPDPDALKKLVYRIASKTRVVYFSITPALSICRKCNWRSAGVHTTCPKCHGKTEVWSRVVGYYRPLARWHEGRQAEFKTRVHYGSEGGRKPHD